MRSLTLWEPWATFMALGHKTIETRSWGTAYRGPLAIHASSRAPDESVVDQVCRRAGIPLDSMPRPDSWPLGRIVCVVELLGCERSTSEHDYPALQQALGDLSPGRVAWRTGGLRRLREPLPRCQGKMGLWTVPEEVLREIELSLAGAA